MSYGSSVKEEVKLQIQVLLASINFQQNKITVHYFSGSNKEDLGRTAFTLYSLARSVDFLEPDTLNNLKNFVNLLTKKVKDNFEDKNIVAICYLLRAKKLLNLDYEEGVLFLEKQDLHSIYTYPVSMYVFVSMTEELRLDKNSYLFSIRNECLKNLEYLLFTGQIDNYPIFSLAEVNYWKGDSFFLQSARKYLLEKLGKLTEQDFLNLSSSGLAKCLEFLGLEEQNKNTNEDQVLRIKTKIFQTLEERKIKNLENVFTIKFIDKIKQENMYLETLNNGHICLDTNTHLLNYYLNYARQN